MSSYIQKSIFSLIVFLLPILAIAATPTWKIIPADSKITFTATQNNSPLTGEFKTFTGDITFDPTQLNTSNVHIVVDIASVQTSYKEVEGTLKSPDWFDTKLFPQAIFTATHFVKTGDKTYEADGSLTIRDKAIPTKLIFTLDEYSTTKALAKGTTTLKRTQFGLGKGDWASTDQVKDDVIVNFVLSAVKK